VDHKDGRLLAVDSTNHVVLSLQGLGASFTTEVLWGSTGASGDADGPALSARLAEPSGLVLTASSVAERLVFVADSGNGKVRMLSLLTNLVYTISSGFSEPKSMVLLPTELLVADATAGYISRLPVNLTTLAQGSVVTVAAATLQQIPGSVGLSRPTWLGYRSITGEVWVSEASGALGVYRMTLTGTRIQVLYSGTWSNPSSNLLPQPRGLGAVTPGPLTMDETVGVANAVLVDVVEKQLFGLELMQSSRSCAELGWNSAYHGSSQVCGRSEGNATVLGARCNYTYNLGVCCSGILNFADAESFCLQQGARLCTQEELFDNEASDSPLYSDCITGSSWVYDGPYDRANIWSSSPCTVPSTGLPGFMTRSGTRSWGNWAPDDCRPSSESAFVKCCADRDLMFPMAGFQPPSAISGEVSQHGLFHSFANTITAVAMDAGKRVLFVAAGSDVVQLSLGAQRFIAAGQIGNEDVIGKPAGIAWSEEDKLLIADQEGHVLRKVDVLLSGSNDIVAGQAGVANDAGDGGLAASSSLFRPSGVAVDGPNRVAYVATGQHRLRRVELSPNGGISSVINVAGVKGAWGDLGPGVDAEMSDPQNLFFENEKVYVADRNNQRVRMLDLSTGRVNSVAGPLLVVSVGSGYQAQYAVFPDPNMTSATLPKDLVTTSPAGVAVAADGSYVILSDEHSQRILHLDRSVVPRRVRVIQGTEAIGDPKDVLLAENGTLFVSDEASHSIFAMEYICDADAVHYTGGCRALNLRRVLGAGSPGDGDVNRREPSTVTSTTVTTFTSTFTSTWSELPCWNHLLGRAGETCQSACARYQGTCDPEVRNNFDFDAFQHSVFWEERVSCQRDARTWWDNAMPSYETNPSSRNYGWCLGTWGMPQQIPCDALFMEYGQPSTTMRRWCKCRRDEMCYLTTTTTVLQPFIPTTTSTRTWTGASTTSTRITTRTSTSTVTRTTQRVTTSPSPYVQLCPQGYDPLPSPLPLTSPTSQNNAIDCGVRCEVTTDCIAFVFDATVGFCSTHSAPTGDFPVSTEPGAVHYTSCLRDSSMSDVLLELLLVDWLPTTSPLNSPGAMALDNARQLLYFSDTGNHKIKVFDMTRQLVMTAAGIGESFTKFSGDGQPARQATMASPKALALDEENSHLYLTDSENHLIRRLKLGTNRLTGIIESVAGTSVGGVAQDGLDPSLTRFNYPTGMALQKMSGGVKLYVSDSANHQVVMVDLASAPNVARKIAGKLDYGLVPTEVGDKGPALAAQVMRPQAMALATSSLELFFAEPMQERLRLMDLTSDIIDTALQTYAVNFSIGEGLAGLSPLDYDAALSLPYSAIVINNLLLTASYGTGQVRQTNLTTGITTDFAGRRNEGYYPVAPSGDGGPATSAILAGPVALAVNHAQQVVYIAESASGRIRQVDLATGIISSLMSSVPAAGESRTLYDLTLDPLRQVLYVSSPSQRVVLGFRLDTHACTAPTTISNAASPSCVEGTEIYGEQCTPQCLSGYAASVNTLYCANGVLTPPSFSCQPAPCSAPWGIAHAAFPSCTEGDRIASGSTCTADCKSGVPDANLTCERGALQPSTFTCVLPTTVTVTVTGGSVVGDGGSTVTAAPVNSVVDGGSFTAVEILELEDSLFGAEVVFDPATAPRSDVALNGSFSFEAVTAGLTLDQVSILCGSNVLRQPLQEALVEVLALLPEDLQILALLPQLPSRRLAEAVAPTHRFSVVFTVAFPPQWASLRFASLRLGTAKAQQEWLEALQKVHFLEAMVEISQNQQRPCSLPSAPAHAPQMLCQEAQVTTVSEGICTTRCLEPFKPSEETLQCFAGFWSPSFFQCKEVQATPAASCPVPTGIPNAAASPCQGQAGSISSGSVCSPQCQVGDSTEAVLVCIDGQLQPSTFSCTSPECSAPNVSSATTPSCLEGDVIAHGRQCTASCLPGLKPTSNLTCYSGQLVPSQFLCFEPSDGSADEFWANGWTRPISSSTTQIEVTSTTLEVASSKTFWDFVTHDIIILVAAIGGGLVALLLLLTMCCCLRRQRKRKLAAQEEQVAWESAAQEISRQNSEFESTSSKSPRKRKNSKANSEASEVSEDSSKSKEATKDGPIQRLEGPDEVKEILRMMAGEEEETKAIAVPQKMPKESGIEDLADLDAEDADVANDADASETSEPELLRLAIEAAEEVERPANHWKDAVFEAMDRELGEAVTKAAELAPLQSRSRSWIAQRPR